jgi:hypothetical protein
MRWNSHQGASEENQTTRGVAFEAASAMVGAPRSSLAANDLDRAVGVKRDRLGHAPQKCAIKSVPAV